MRPSWFWLLILLLLASCSVPKITVMDDPLSPDEHLNLGLAYEQKKDFDLAIREYRLAGPGQPLAYHLLGNVYFQLKDFTKAEQSYRQAITLMPNNPDPLNNLAWMLLTMNSRLDEAETLARRAVQLAKPDKVGPYRDTLDEIMKARHQATSPSGGTP